MTQNSLPNMPQIRYAVGVPQPPKRKPRWPVIIGVTALIGAAASLWIKTLVLIMLASDGIAIMLVWGLAALEAVNVAGGILLIKRRYAGRTALLVGTSINIPFIAIAASWLICRGFVAPFVVVLVFGAYSVFLLVWLSRKHSYRGLRD